MGLRLAEDDPIDVERDLDLRRHDLDRSDEQCADRQQRSEGGDPDRLDEPLHERHVVLLRVHGGLFPKCRVVVGHTLFWPTHTS